MKRLKMWTYTSDPFEIQTNFSDYHNDVNCSKFLAKCKKSLKSKIPNLDDSQFEEIVSESEGAFMSEEWLKQYPSGPKYIAAWTIKLQVKSDVDVPHCDYWTRF